MLINEKNREFWHAIYCKPRQEKKVSKSLQNLGIEHYLPLIKVYKIWSDRKKIIEEPLLRSYLFIPQYVVQEKNIKEIDGVLNYVYYNGKLAKIFEHEIARIKDFLGELIITEEQFKEFVIGDQVEIKRGAFVGQKGDVIEEKNKTLKLQIDSLNYVLEITVEKGNVNLIKRKE